MAITDSEWERANSPKKGLLCLLRLHSWGELRPGHDLKRFHWYGIPWYKVCRKCGHIRFVYKR